MADFTTNKVAGQQLSADEWNQLADFDNAVISSDQTPATGDLNQLGKALGAYVGLAGYYGVDSGSANAYAIAAPSPFKAPHKLYTGLTVRFLAGNANTGAAATLNAFGLGVKDIKLMDAATNPPAGTIPTNFIRQYTYDGTRWLLSNLPTNFLLGSIQIFTSSGTWTKPSGCRAVEVEVIGAGGQGGSLSSSNPSTGGGGGGYSYKFITSGLGSTETVTIGVGGSTGTTTQNGQDGTASSFGAHCSATGGTGGKNNSASGVGIGGAGSGGTFNLAGSDGGVGVNTTLNGTGGSAPRGGGSPTGGIGGQGGIGKNYGSGGGASNGSFAGNVGAGGIIIVREYY